MIKPLSNADISIIHRFSYFWKYLPTLVVYLIMLGHSTLTNGKHFSWHHE